MGVMGRLLSKPLTTRERGLADQFAKEIAPMLFSLSKR
jgi:hypothetical protein